jgi:hypothetical protein
MSFQWPWNIRTRGIDAGDNFVRLHSWDVFLVYRQNTADLLHFFSIIHVLYMAYTWEPPALRPSSLLSGNDCGQNDIIVTQRGFTVQKT